MSEAHDHPADPLRPHQHEPNPDPPGADPDFWFWLPDGRRLRLGVAELATYPQTAVPDCTIVSTGHGTSGPFTFEGVALRDLVEAHVPGHWDQVEVIGGDGFGNRIEADELDQAGPDRPIILAHMVDGQALTRRQGLIRLIVPGERDDALRQVKWVATVRVLAAAGPPPVRSEMATG